jgi:lysophospholipase L1-like esterase
MRSVKLESDGNGTGPTRSSAVLRELRSVPTLVVVAICLFVGIPLTIGLTPGQQLTVAGQHFTVGARDPSLSLSGPAQLVQIGNTRLDIARLTIYGPLRPQLTLGPVQREAAVSTLRDSERRRAAQTEAADTVSAGFLRWYGWATLGLLAFVLAVTAVAGLLRLRATLRSQSRIQHRQVSAAEIWQRSAGQLRGMTVVAVAVTLLAWAASGALAYAGAVRGLRDVRSLSDLVGTYYVSPSAVGPTVRGFTGAVIGDSRASRVGGPLVSRPSEDDRACVRSTDSLANEVGRLLDTQVLNLACPGASIAAGLRGPQQQGGRVLPAQVGRLKKADGLDFVVVVIGPNDLYWGDFLAYCYAVDDCQDNLTRGEFDYRIAAFDREYGDLLQDLNDLPGQPQIVVMTSYDVFEPDADCQDTRGPAQARGLTRANIELLAERNAELNGVLESGARKYGFAVARPRLTTLCAAAEGRLAADLQGLADSHPFHPTGIGMVRLAASVAQVIERPGG